jgi:hypothetical protein
MYERVQRLHAEEHKAVLASVQELTETLSAESRLRDQEAARRQEAQDQLRDVRSAADKLRVQVRREEAFVLLCFVSFCCVLLCFALFCFALLCFGRKTLLFLYAYLWYLEVLLHWVAIVMTLSHCYVHLTVKNCAGGRAETAAEPGGAPARVRPVGPEVQSTGGAGRAHRPDADAHPHQQGA